ncbi:MAG: DUF664 domain-containing protein [Propionicimonas sp.]|nr:DUF664 domain-containing protein [Propionicimonas sp.]
MTTTDLVLDSLERVHELIPAVLDGLDRDDVLWRPDPDSNSIGWLVWHLTRVEDDHLADLGGIGQVWPDWAGRFGLPYPVSAHGYGMTSAEVGAFDVPSPSLLVDYAAAVAEQSRQVLAGLGESDYDRVVDTRWDPPVTLAVRLVSVMVETAQHIGQAAYVRGLRERAIARPSDWVGHV